MNDFYEYPPNDYRNYLMHWGKGEQAKDHKYISRSIGKAGKWIYTYAKNSIKNTRNKLSNAWDRSSLSSTGKKRRENANKVWQNMRIEDDRRVRNAISEISDSLSSKDDNAVDKAISKRNTAWASEDATNKKHNKKSKKYLDWHSSKYYEGVEANKRNSYSKPKKSAYKDRKISPKKTAKRRNKSVATFYGWKNDNGGDWDVFVFNKYGHGKLRSQGKYASRKPR